MPNLIDDRHADIDSSAHPVAAAGSWLLPGAVRMRRAGVSLPAVRLQVAAEQGESHADEGGVGDRGRRGPRGVGRPAAAATRMTPAIRAMPVQRGSTPARATARPKARPPASMISPCTVIQAPKTLVRS